MMFRPLVRAAGICAMLAVACGAHADVSMDTINFDDLITDSHGDPKSGLLYTNDDANPSNGYAQFNAGSTGSVGVAVSGWKASTQAADFVNLTEDLYHWAGSGVGLNDNESSPEHSVDSEHGYEMVVFEFDTAVTLTHVISGWPNASYTDSHGNTVTDYSDITVLAGNANNDYRNTAFQQNTGSSTMLNQGWSLIGHYANAGNTTTAINSGHIKSTIWAVAAYLDGLSDGTISDHQDYAHDYIKLLGVSFKHGDPNVVPAPAALVLLLIGLLGLRLRGKAQSC